MVCPDCGCTAFERFDPCPECGKQDAVAKVTGVEAKLEQGVIGTVTERVDPVSGVRETEGAPGTGGTSIGRVTEDGIVEHRLVGHLPLGRDNELHIGKILAAYLNGTRRIVARYESGADDRGEDVVLIFADGGRQAVQVTMALGDRSLWGGLRREGQCLHERDVAGVAAELHRSISRKAAKIEPLARPQIWLALDARHTPAAAYDEVIHHYRSAYGEACSEFGFANVWVVGPVQTLCFSLCR